MGDYSFVLVDTLSACACAIFKPNLFTYIPHEDPAPQLCKINFRRNICVDSMIKLIYVFFND